MIKLTPGEVDAAGRFIRRHGREIDYARFQMHFERDLDMRDTARSSVPRILARYQNADGGFGHGLESDFALPSSSPMATSVGLRLLDEFLETPASRIPCDPDPDPPNLDEGCSGHPDVLADVLAPAIRYLERTFDHVRGGWLAVPREVNDYPHAIWWHFYEAKSMTVIDRNWGNPSAELIGYLHKYRRYVTNLDPDLLVDRACEYLKAKSEFGSEHEVYCFISLHELLPRAKAQSIESKLKGAVESLVRRDPREWVQYVPRPHHFGRTPKLGQLFGFGPEVMDADLDDLVSTIRRDGGIYPVWNWGQYAEEWERARLEWAGFLTLRSMLVLKSWGRAGQSG